MNTEAISLFELNQHIKSIIKGNATFSYWIVAEIGDFKVNTSGHCYMELIEKDEKTDFLKAKAKATVWSSNYRIIKPYFETSTGTSLSTGIKIMVKVTVEFHELYGLSLNIIDIEPSFTVGELAMRKQEIINRLTDEGVIDMNKELEFPLLPKRIAVISSKTAAGYGDFINQLLTNPYQYKFHTKLFPAFMQGDEAEQSIISALERIHAYEHAFDLVVLIRGGGSKADLNCFDSYWLALHVSQFNLPILTGIGHEQDETIVDIVAHKKLKTPTAVAEYLISHFLEQDEYVNSLAVELLSGANYIVRFENEKLAKIGLLFSSDVKQLINNSILALENIRLNLFHKSKRFISLNNQDINNYMSGINVLSKKRVLFDKYELMHMSNSLKHVLKTYLSSQKYKLGLLEEKNQNLDPLTVLKRGYSITTFKGKVINDSIQLHPGNVIESVFYKGKAKSKVLNNKEGKQESKEIK